MKDLPTDWLDRRLDYRLPMLRGSDVRIVQLRLAALGYSSLRSADGLYGPRTRQAVREFQRDRGLEADGVVAEGTMAALMVAEADGGAAAPAVGQPPTPVRRPAAPTAAATAGKPAEIVPAEWLPSARAQRVVCHWTAGGHQPSPVDLESYHFLVCGDGEIVRGRHAVDANDSTANGVYAAHVAHLNTGSIGVAMCCMRDARERPFDPGPSPMTDVQWRRMAALVAQLCRRYGIAVSPATVLGHGEVQTILEVQQNAKWDPMKLPWAPERSFAEVGAELRAAVAAALHAVDGGETPRRLRATVAGRPLREARAFDCALWLPVGALVADLGWELQEPDTSGLTLVAEGGRTLYLPFAYAPEDAGDPSVDAGKDRVLAAGFVRAETVAEQLGLGLEIAEDGQALELRGRIGDDVERRGGKRWRAVTIRPDDTLSKVAARLLGDPRRWTEITDADGKPFTPATAKRLAVGARVLVPEVRIDTKDVDGRRVAPTLVAATLDDLTEEVAAHAHRLLRAHASRTVPVLVASCVAHGVTKPAQVAYVLATAEHESSFGRDMEEIWRNTDAQRNYEGRFGNDRPGDGKRYRGRGYVQITFKANYRKFDEVVGGIDLVAKPERAAEPDVAAAIIAVGMRDGLFRRHKLDDFLQELDGDFVQARQIVNGDIDVMDAGDPTNTPRGQRIAQRARAFTALLARHLQR